MFKIYTFTPSSQNRRIKRLKALRTSIDTELNRIVNDIMKHQSEFKDIAERLINLHCKRVAFNQVKNELYKTLKKVKKHG